MLIEDSMRTKDPMEPEFKMTPLRQLFLSIIISVFISGCATRCYVTPFSDLLYNDHYNNKITVISRGMFAKEIDTSFIKSNISGLTFYEQLMSDTLRFDCTISKIEKINRNLYLLYVETKPHTTNPTLVSNFAGCKNYKMTTKKINGKVQLKHVKKLGECMWLTNKKTKRLLCQ